MERYRFPQKMRPAPMSPPPPRFNFWQTLLVLALIGLVAWSFLVPISRPTELPISQVITKIKNGEVRQVVVNGNQLTVTLNSGEEIVSRREVATDFLATLSQAGADPASIPDGVVVAEGLPWGDILLSLLPVFLIALIFFYFIRQARGGTADILSFGRSRAVLFERGRKPGVTFNDVAGVDEAKQELLEVVDFLKNPGKYRALGARIPKGVLLVGPAGTGKTLLARAVAGEAHVPFYSMSGSEFMEMLVGVGAARVRDLFDTAKRSAPSIIFIDEIESIGRQRGMGITGGHEEREQTLNQILTEMDGFTPSDNVIVLAATNRPELLDPALTRPGRFDRRVVLDLPDIEGRKDIVKIHMRGKPMGPDVDLEKVAKRTVGFSGADIENMLNEAAILAARLNKKAIGMPDLEEAATKVKLGPEKKRLQSPQERRLTAYHEAGHAIVASVLPHMDPVHRVSIVSRGLALGYTEIPPAADRYQHTQTELLERITGLLGGRAAEELIFNEFSAGASSDLAQATAIARRMVSELGMSSLGPVSLTFGEMEWYGVLREPGNYLSEETSNRVDREVMRILNAAYAQAKKLLSKNRVKLDRVAAALLEKETLEEEEFQRLIAAGKDARNTRS